MDWRRPMGSEVSEVGGCRIAFVFAEAVFGIGGIGLLHQAVAGDFGNDAGCSDGEAQSVAADKGGVRHGQTCDPESIDEGVVHPAQIRNSTGHRQVRRTQDV